MSRLLLCQLALASKNLFLARWRSIPKDQRIIIREDVRIMWCRDFANRPMFNTFLRMTED